MKVLIVDDEPLARVRLAALIEESGIGQVVGEADNGVVALEQVSLTAPDLVMLDVRMPKMDGIEAARHLAGLEEPPVVIFTTAYDDRALDAFETSAIDYLLKPIRAERLKQSLERAQALVAGRRVLDTPSAPPEGERSHVSAVVGGAIRLMAVRDILYFQADQGYVSAVSVDERLLLEDSLKALEDEFVERFVRVHRNALVQVAHVRALERDPSGNAVVTLLHGEEKLAVSRRLAANVRKRLRGTDLT